MMTTSRVAAAPVLAAWQGLRNGGSPWFRRLLLLVALALPLGLLLVSGRAALAAIGGIAAIVLMGGWMALMSNLLLQNHPQLARLVPGHAERLRRTAMAVWWLLAGAAFAVSALLTDGPLRLGLPLAGWLLLLAWTLRWPLLWALPWVAQPLVQGLAGAALLREGWQALVALDAALAWPLALLLLGLGAVAHRPLFEDGGARHVRRYQRLLDWRRAVHGQRDPNKPGTPPRPGSLRERWQRLMSWGYRQDFARRVAAGNEGQVVPRLLLALGPQAHGGSQFGALLVHAAILLLAWAALMLAQRLGLLPWDLLALSEGTPAFIGLAYGLGLLQQLRIGIARTGPERALLSLLPGLPARATLNRRLALRLMGQYQLACLAIFGLLALLLPWQESHAKLLSFGLIALLSGLLLWTDWARLGRPGAVDPVFALPVLAALGAVLVMRLGWLSLEALLLGGALLGLGLGLWRWRALQAAPGLFARPCVSG